MASVTDGYTQLESGYWEKLSDGSSPYLFDGTQMVFMSAGDSGGGSVDVLGTVIETFTDNTEVPKGGDTLQDVLDKFYTFDRNLPTEVRTVGLSGFTPRDGEINSRDTVMSAFEKSQGQIDAINDSTGAPNGLAVLDADSKIPVAHLPSTVFRFMGHWNTETNTPELKDNDDSMQGGEVYQCSHEGEFNGINLAVGDLVVYEYATKKWVKSLASGEVISVNAMTGNVVLNGSNILVSDTDTRTIEDALDFESSRLSTMINLDTDLASGFIEFAGIRWGYERTNALGGRQFYQALDADVHISYVQKAFYDGLIEPNRSASTVVTKTKHYYDPLSLSDLKELVVIHVFIGNQVWKVNQLVAGSASQKLAMWAERVV